MKLSTDVIYDMLAERYTLQRFGLKGRKRELLLPVFYRPDMQTRTGAIYLCRTEDLRRKPLDNCLFFCVGPKPSDSWNMWHCEIIYIQDANNDLFAVMNTLMRIFGRLLDWHDRMRELSITGGDLGAMLDLTIPLLTNRITVTDYNLNVLAYCEREESPSGPTIVRSERYVRIPLEKITEQGSHMRRMMRLHEPFFVSEEGRPDNYCINLFVGDNYIGCCSLQEDLHPLRKGDLELFALFAEFVRGALDAQGSVSGSQFVTAGKIFEQLVRRYPVSRYDVDRALDLIAFNLHGESLDAWEWRCLCIRSMHEGRMYPEGYLCATVEDLLDKSVAFFVDDMIIVFCLVRRGADTADTFDVLDEYLKDMHFIAGLSRAFTDIFDAYSYYRQACCALELGKASRQEEDGCLRFAFDDCALRYMLERCCGDFDARFIVDPALFELAQSEGSSVDYIETLRCYLDNNCNASKTAAAMYLHRSTLTQRIEHIERLVDLSTPERRLFLNLCLHLPDADRLLR